MSSSPSIATKWVVRLLAGGLDRKTRSTAPRRRCTSLAQRTIRRGQSIIARCSLEAASRVWGKFQRSQRCAQSHSIWPSSTCTRLWSQASASVNFSVATKRGDHALGDLVGDFDCVAARPVLSARPGRDVSTRGSRLRCAAGRASRRSLAAIAVGAAGRCEWRRCRDGRARNPRARSYTIIARTRRNLRARSAKCLSTPWSSSLAPPYSITSSARARSVAGTSRPSDLAVLRLITNSYLVGACTGRSAGFWPLRMQST